MFDRHATFRSAAFKSRGLRHVPSHGLEAAYANDNPRGLRLPAGQRRPRPLRLACHWILADGNRLECRWQVENLGELSVEEPHSRRVTRKISGLPLTLVRCRAPAAASGRALMAGDTMGRLKGRGAIGGFRLASGILPREGPAPATQDFT